MRTHGNVQKHESTNPIQRRLIDAFHARVVDLVRAAAPSCILEVGCGEGYVLAELQRAGVGADLIGVDLSERAIDAARARVAPPVRLYVGDAREVAQTLDGRAADLVMMLEVLEHLHEPESMVENLTQLTTRHVLLSVPREPFFRGMNLLRLKNVRAFGNDPEHVNHWSARGFVELVARHFDVVATVRPFPWTLVLARVRTSQS
jgi:2-polyprenyl-3-methyl-5-hydroxy-6-metoxy-1,4-benzoquinol methylase